jgi:hypothetical protein
MIINAPLFVQPRSISKKIKIKAKDPMTQLLPLKTLSETAAVGTLVDGWNLAEPSEDGSHEPRTFSLPIIFSVPFDSTPVVSLGLAGFDIDQRDSARINLQAANISQTGFTALISTWRDTRVYSVTLSWLAVGN